MPKKIFLILISVFISYFANAQNDSGLYHNMYGNLGITNQSDYHGIIRAGITFSKSYFHHHLETGFANEFGYCFSKKLSSSIDRHGYIVWFIGPTIKYKTTKSSHFKLEPGFTLSWNLNAIHLPNDFSLHSAISYNPFLEYINHNKMGNTFGYRFGVNRVTSAPWTGASTNSHSLYKGIAFTEFTFGFVIPYIKKPFETKKK